MPKVSVIIPVYNTELYLNECLDSIIHQTLSDIEVICINDGSSDNSLGILNSYAENDLRIIVLSQENQGQSAARNNGLKIATGDYVYFMDSDDILALDALEKLYNFSDENKLDIIYFGADVFFESVSLRQKHMNYVNYYDRKGIYDDVFDGLDMLREMNKNGDYRPSPCLQFLSSDFIKTHKISFHEGIIHEDNLFSLLNIVQAKRVMCINDKFFYRRMRDNSTMTKPKKAENVIGYFICFIEMCKYCLCNNEYDKIVKTQIDSYLRSTRNIYQELSEHEKKRVVFAKDSFEEFMFEVLVRSKNIENDVQRTDDAIKCIALQNQLNEIYKSKSYKVGRFITFVPRKMRIVRQCYHDRGLKYTIWRITKELSKILPSRKRDIADSENLSVEKKEVLISVVLPVYNVEKYLAQCLDSLLNQTFNQFEIICVNDGATDSCPEIIKQYAQKDSRIKVVNQFNQYLGFARNSGLKIASGKYVIFIDSDDFVEPALLEKAYQKAEKTNADLVVFAADIYNQNTNKFEDAPWMLQEYRLPKTESFTPEMIQKYLFNFTAPNAWTKLYRREFLLQNNLFYPPFRSAEDLSHTYCALSLAKTIAVENTVLIHYRKGLTTNISSNKDDKALFFYDAYSLLQADLMQLGLYEKYEQSYINRFLSSSLYEIESLNTEKAKNKVRQYFVDEIIYKMGLNKKEKNYFYNNSDFDKMQNILSDCEIWKEESSDVKVSVVIPVFNAELYLEQCITSVMNQSLKEIEIICVDDGSTDHSMEILRKYESIDPRIKIFQQENSYAGVARNYGMRQSTGQYVIFLDADDFFELDLLKKMYISCENNRTDMAICAADSFHDKDKVYKPMPWQLKRTMIPEKNIITPTEIKDVLFVFCTGVPWNKMFKRSFVKGLHLCFQDTRCANDLYFTLLAMANANAISILDDVLVHYRVGIVSNLQSSNDKNPFDFCRALMGIRAELIRSGQYKNYQRSFVNLALNNCMYNLKKVSNDAIAYRHLAKKIKEFYIPLFEIDKFGEDYFYDKQYWNEYSAFMQQGELN